MTWRNSSTANETSFHQNKVDSNLEAILYRSIFGSIAILSFLGNLLLCLVICRRRKLLSRPYNNLMLNLAATDMLTGLNLFLQIQSDFNHNSLSNCLIPLRVHEFQSIFFVWFDFNQVLNAASPFNLWNKFLGFTIYECNTLLTGAPNDRMFPNTPEVSHKFLYSLVACLVNLELP